MATPLRDQIAAWQSRGFFVTSQTETSASMVRPKHFSFLWATFWFLWCGVGVLIYVFYYASQKDQHIYVTSEPPGPSQASLSGPS